MAVVTKKNPKHACAWGSKLLHHARSGSFATLAAIRRAGAALGMAVVAVCPVLVADVLVYAMSVGRRNESTERQQGN
jgi:hypothetical protein